MMSSQSNIPSQQQSSSICGCSVTSNRVALQSRATTGLKCLFLTVELFQLLFLNLLNLHHRYIHEVVQFLQYPFWGSPIFLNIFIQSLSFSRETKTCCEDFMFRFTGGDSPGFHFQTD